MHIVLVIISIIAFHSIFALANEQNNNLNHKQVEDMIMLDAKSFNEFCDIYKIATNSYIYMGTSPNLPIPLLVFWQMNMKFDINTFNFNNYNQKKEVIDSNFSNDSIQQLNPHLASIFVFPNLLRVTVQESLFDGSYLGTFNNAVFKIVGEQLPIKKDQSFSYKILIFAGEYKHNNKKIYQFIPFNQENILTNMLILNNMVKDSLEGQKMVASLSKLPIILSTDNQNFMNEHLQRLSMYLSVDLKGLKNLQSEQLINLINSNVGEDIKFIKNTYDETYKALCITK
jgi:hypothetical protein